MIVAIKRDGDQRRPTRRSCPAILIRSSMMKSLLRELFEARKLVPMNK
jgi:hypothetical protein